MYVGRKKVKFAENTEVNEYELTKEEKNWKDPEGKSSSPYKQELKERKSEEQKLKKQKLKAKIKAIIPGPLKKLFKEDKGDSFDRNAPTRKAFRGKADKAEVTRL